MIEACVYKNKAFIFIIKACIYSLLLYKDKFSI